MKKKYMYEVYYCFIYSFYWFYIKWVNVCKYMYKLLLLISIKRNRWLFDIIMEVIENFLSFIGLFNFNKWNFMFRILFYMNEDLFYYIIYFLDLENYIIVRFLYMLILDWLILEIFKENFYFIVIKLLYGFCI